MDRKLLQSDVAKILNVSTDCITYWENNRTRPQVNYVPRIIKFPVLLPFEFDTSPFIGKLKVYRFRNGLSYKRLGKILNVDATTIRVVGLILPTPPNLLYPGSGTEWPQRHVPAVSSHWKRGRRWCVPLLRCDRKHGPKG